MEENLRRIHRFVCSWLSPALHVWSLYTTEFKDAAGCSDLYLVITRYYQNLQSALTKEKLQLLPIPSPPISQKPRDNQLETERRDEPKEDKEQKNASVYKRRRKREQPHRAGCCHGDRASLLPELDDCLDLFTWSSSSANMLTGCCHDWLDSSADCCFYLCLDHHRGNPHCTPKLLQSLGWSYGSFLPCLYMHGFIYSNTSGDVLVSMISKMKLSVLI